MTKRFGALIDILSRCEKIIIILHPSPDGDTIGSGLAIWNALTQMDKLAAVVCQDNVPHIYKFLERHEVIVKPSEIDWIPDLAIAVDVADVTRMGDAREIFDMAKYSVCIDHHSTNSAPFASLSYINPAKGAASLLIYDLIRELGTRIDRMIAESLYVGISTDTGNFSFSNTTPETLVVAAELLALHELDVPSLTRRLFRLKRPERLKLTAKAIGSLSFKLDGKISIMCLREADFVDCGARQDDTEGLINIGMDCEGVAVAILATETAMGTKLSFRSQAPVDVGELAASMGGGGHARASGCTLAMPLDEAIDYAVGKTCTVIRDFQLP